MGTQLARRWLSALVLVPEDERESVVREVEQSIVNAYGADTHALVAGAMTDDPDPPADDEAAGAGS
ncbi:MAG: hypothetical protein AAFP26_12590 [Planctomycetota bacterium]